MQHSQQPQHISRHPCRLAGDADRRTGLRARPAAVGAHLAGGHLCPRCPERLAHKPLPVSGVFRGSSFLPLLYVLACQPLAAHVRLRGSQGAGGRASTSADSPTVLPHCRSHDTTINAPSLQDARSSWTTAWVCHPPDGCTVAAGGHAGKGRRPIRRTGCLGRRTSTNGCVGARSASTPRAKRWTACCSTCGREGEFLVFFSLDVRHTHLPAKLGAYIRACRQLAPLWLTVPDGPSLDIMHEPILHSGRIRYLTSLLPEAHGRAVRS